MSARASARKKSAASAPVGDAHPGRRFRVHQYRDHHRRGGARLLEHKNLRVVTNSINVASICARNSSFDVVVACGTVRHRDNGIVGASAERFIREFRVDYGIIGISGIDEEGNLLDYDYREVAVARTIIECSRRVFLVTDRSKFGRPAMVRVAHLSDINALFTDGPIDKKCGRSIHEHGVELFMV